MNLKPVVFEREAFYNSDFSPVLLEFMRKEVEKKVKERTIRAKKKWLEVVILQDGQKYGCPCKDTQDAIVIGKPWRTRKRGG